MARYRTRYKRKRRKRRYKRNSGMKKATKDMLKGGGVATAILVFIPEVYASIKQYFPQSFGGQS
tara:strand:- start:74 stop:265 length:192 start_codon:yes stop_codon:yes gene_type:complete